MYLEEIFMDLRNEQSNVGLRKKRGAMMILPRGRSLKLSDEEVREMRKMHRSGISKVVICAKFPDVSVKTVDDILFYKTRLSPACDI